MLPAYKVADRQLAGTASGLRQIAEDEGADAELLTIFAATLEIIAEKAGVLGGDVADVGPVDEIPTRVEAALQGMRQRDGDSYRSSCSPLHAGSRKMARANMNSRSPKL
jgi:hypothetical protein